MNNFTFITPEKYYRLLKASNPDVLEHLIKIAKQKAKKCENDCGEDAWKLAGTGLCFTCTTGENDASDDYEVVSLTHG